MSKMLFVLLVVTGFQVVRVASLDLSIRPDHVRVTEAAQSVSFICSADVAFAGCQFRLWADDNKAGTLLELSRGSLTQADPANLNDELIGYSYSGRGLGAGDCGVSLQVKGYKTWMVVCRVRAESGGWKYAWADLYAHSYESLPHNRTTPREVVVLPGGEARFMLKAGEPLSLCYFYLPGGSDWLHFDQRAASDHSPGRHRYLGAGLQSGECGLALSDITEADNGQVRCGIATSPTLDYRFSALIVARPPTTPTLSLVYTGNNVTATCEVQESRPVANMSWVLGDAVIHHGVTDDTQATAQDEWRWPWMKSSIKQTLTLQLQPQDHEQVLACVVSHVALVQPQEAKRVISFERPTIATTTRTTSSTAHMTTPSTTESTAPSTIVSTAPSTTVSTAPGLNSLATNYLDLLCQEYRVRPTQHGNTSCPKDEVHEYRIREARAAARTAEMNEEAAKIKLEAAKAEKATGSEVAELQLEAERMKVEAEMIAIVAAKSSAKAEEARAKAEEARATASLLDVKAAQSRAKAEEARAREEEAWALNAEEGLQFERERRTKSSTRTQP